MARKKPTFLRSDTVRHFRLGKLRRKLQKWRKPRGRHSKIRRKRVGYPVQPGIGYKQPVQRKPLFVVHSMKELEHAPREAALILSRRVGARKKIDIVKMAQEKGISLKNVGAKL